MSYVPSAELWQLVCRVVRTLPDTHQRALHGVVIQEWPKHTMPRAIADAGCGTIRFRDDFLHRTDREAIIVHECMHLVHDDEAVVTRNPQARAILEALADVSAAELGYYVDRSTPIP